MIAQQSKKIELVADEETIRIVYYQQPKKIYDLIPDRIKESVLNHKPIPIEDIDGIPRHLTWHLFIK